MAFRRNDPDGRRTRAVARLARWSGRAQWWTSGGWDVPGFEFPLVRLARARKAAAERAVDRVARDDVADERVDHRQAWRRISWPDRPTAEGLFAFDDAVARYRACVRRHAAAEGLPPQPSEGQARRDRPGR